MDFLWYVVFVDVEVFFGEVFGRLFVVVVCGDVEFDVFDFYGFEIVGCIYVDEVFCVVFVGEVGDGVYVGDCFFVGEGNFLDVGFLVECCYECFVEVEFNVFECLVFWYFDFCCCFD